MLDSLLRVYYGSRDGIYNDIAGTIISVTRRQGFSIQMLRDMGSLIRSDWLDWNSMEQTGEDIQSLRESSISINTTATTFYVSQFKVFSSRSSGEYNGNFGFRM